MHADPYERAKRLFLEALRLPEAERAGYLARSDPTLRAEVLGLLRHHAAAEPAADLHAPFVPPERIGPFRVLGVVGHGGMGVVYRAQRGEEPPVALKVLEVGIFSARLLSRFRREADALRRLDHPGIAHFLESGEFETRLGPQPYYAMELVEGESLRGRSADPDWPETARIAFLADLAEALHHAHEQGVIHRDIKPENVIVTPEGSPKVLDFGVARITGADVRGGTLATASGVLLGTIRYMSPEQAQGLSEEIDRRSDVYALGVLAYELLSGALPYQLHTRSLTRALVQVATLPARSLGELRPSLRGPVERIVAQALEKRPGDRYPTAAALAADLRRYLEGRGIEAREPSFIRRGARFARRRPLAAVGVAAMLLALVVGAWLTAPSRSPAARAARVRAAAARACDLLDSVDVRLHLTARTPESLEHAFALLAQARVEIARLGRAEHAPDLRRYAAWREGEAHFFLASLRSDPDGFLRAAGAWERARAPAREPNFRPALPDTTVRIFERMLLFWPQQADGGLALAYSEVARSRRPAGYSRLACRHEEAAWLTFARASGVATDPLRAEPAPGTHAVYGRALNGLGAAMTATGFYEDSLGLLDRGLEVLVRADQSGTLLPDPAPYASLQHHLGRAWLWRARLGRQRADLDSAVARLEIARAVRASLPGNTSLFETDEALAEAYRMRVRLEEDGERGRWITRARELLREGLARATRPFAEGHRASLAIVLAAATVDEVVLTGNAAPLDVAESLLESPGRRFARDGHPVQFAHVERERGRIAACRWLITGRTEHWNAATQHFASAAEALALSQHRPFRRELGAVGQWMQARQRVPPSLTVPVFRI